MVIIKEYSEACDREVLHLITQTENQEQPSEAEMFEAAVHFIGPAPEGHIRSIKTAGTFPPDKTALAKLASVPAFTCGSSKFWETRLPFWTSARQQG